VEGFAGLVNEALGIGIDNKEMGAGQMALRAAIVYLVTVAIVRMGKKRFMGKATAFDVILGIMLGSVVSRAITGNAPFLPTLAAAAVLLAMHWLMSGIALRAHWFGATVKGHAYPLVKDGTVDWKTMRHAHLTRHDLEEDLRRKGLTDLSQVAEAWLERNGDISIVKAKPPPEVIDVEVRDGVQTVRIRLG